ncbi:MAG: RagB/SusD family nutrient uptake outer membrane protein [Cyclobacteriaceae bacterium]|nr:RagB/SusD family nutrient uptake outer membrane protein [Cyclobacteriaceae bacterium]
MKTNNITRYFLTLIFTVGVITSCKDYLEIQPVSSFGPDAVFSDVENTTKALIGVYSSLGGDNGYGIRISMYYAYDNDEMMGQGATPYPDNERRDIAHYSVQPSNTQLAAPFNQLYAGIEKANICIKYIPEMDMYKNGTTSQQTDLKRLYGEALTLRAQYYYELVRNWGDVPAQFVPSSDQGDLFKGREDRNVILDKILTDLELASTLVPWRSEVPADERITQGAVRGLRARIALARGGYSLRGKVMLRSADFLDYYKIARDECLAVMQSNQHSLNPSYKSVFKDAIAAHALEPNGEIMWEVAMTGGTSATGDSKLGYYNGPRVNGNGNGALTILPTYFYLFEANDTRRDVTCAPYDVNLNTTFAGRPLTTMVDGKFRRDWMTNPAPSPTSTQQYFGLNWPVIRYSDVLLMYAEAENEINNGPTPQGIAAFEQVRKRAYGANPIGTTPLLKAEFFNALLIERSLELGGEGIRKYDLLRWNLLTAKLDEAKAQMNAMALGTGTYTVGSLPSTTQSIANIPVTMYYQTTATTSTGLIWLNSFYAPTPGVAPANSTAVLWRGNLVGAPSNATTIPSTLLTYFAISFTPGKSELLPLASSVIDSNPGLGQNDGF